VTFTAFAQAIAPGVGTPGGTVTFSDYGSAIGTGVLDGTGHGTFSTSSLAVGNHSITASFGGDVHFNAAGPSGVYGFHVGQSGALVAVGSSPNSSVFGQAVTFSATMSAAGAGSGTPTGTATFQEGHTVLAANVALVAGQATFSIASLSVGSHTVTAVYSGDTNFPATTGDDAASPQVINKAATTVALQPAPTPSTPSVFGQSVTFTAFVRAVAPGAGIASGTVTFSDSAVPVGTGLLDGTGHGTFSTSSLAVGNHSITASFGGDGRFSVSGPSGVYGYHVDKSGTTAAVGSSPNASVSGQTVTFTGMVTVNSLGAGSVSGTIDFKEGSTDLTPGGVNLIGGNQATFTISTLSQGNHTIAAIYSGDGNFLSSTGDDSTAPQVVNPSGNSTLVNVAITSSSAVYGQSVTFTATVGFTASGFTPSGTVTFRDSGNVLGSGSLDASAVATLSNRWISCWPSLDHRELWRR